MTALKSWFRLLFLARYSLLAGIAAPVLVPWAASLKPDLLGSMLVLEEPLQLFHITWISLVVAIFVLISFRLTQVNAAARFADYRISLEKLQQARVAAVAEEREIASLWGRIWTFGRAGEAVGTPKFTKPRPRSAVHAQADVELHGRGDHVSAPSPLTGEGRGEGDGAARNQSLTSSPYPTRGELSMAGGGTATASTGPNCSVLQHHMSGRPGWRWRWLLLALMGLPLPLVCVYHTSLDLSPAWTTGPLSPGMLGAVAMLGGVAVATLVLALLLVSQQLLLDPEAVSCDLLPFEVWPWLARLKQIRLPLWQRFTRSVACWAEQLGPGYTQRGEGSGELVMAPGHSQLAIWLAIGLVFYLFNYVRTFTGHDIPSEHGSLAALFFLMVLVMFLHGILAGLSFLLDYYRASTLLALVMLSLVSSALFNTEHVYELNPPYRDTAQAPPLAPNPELNTLFDDWKPPHRTLVVVSAAGGGIQAAAWTTQVLAGLDEMYGPDFTRSVGLVSGVSGGSVGTMYYMTGGNWTSGGAPFNPDSRQQMIAAAEASSLEATGWGIAYPDLMRSFVPFLVPRHIDRGWAIERSWQSHIAGDVHLRDWIPAIQKHQMPIPVFNAVLAETGQRLVISPVLKEKRTHWSASDPCEFFNLYPGDEANPRVTTAVRLSATFPYVSPISRPDREEPAEKNYHVADGAYAENEGIFTIVDWVQQLTQRYDHAEQRPFDTILVLRIQPFNVPWRPNPAQPNKGWTYDVLGPIDTIENVRGASQAERNNFDLNILVKILADRAAGDSNQLKIVWTNFTFQADRGYVTPMSWHLTTGEKNEIREAWEDLVADRGRPNRPQKDTLAPIANNRRESPLKTVEQFFPRVTPQVAHSGSQTVIQ